MNFASMKDWFNRTPVPAPPPRWNGRAGSWYTQQTTAQTLGVVAYRNDHQSDTVSPCPYKDDDPLAEHWERGYAQAGEAFR